MKNLFTKNYWAMKGLALLVLVVMGGGEVMGQASITSTSAVTDALSASVGVSAPTNWTIQGTGTSGSTWRGTDQINGTSGGWYGNGNISFLGSSSASNGNATWLLQNNSGSTLTGFTLAFTARMWKNVTNSPSVTVSYSNSGTITNPTAGALTNALSSLTFNDATTNVSTGAARTQTVTGLTIANGQYIFVRFIHAGGSSSDNLGWDDLSFTPTLATVPEINIKQSTTSYATASTYAFGNQMSGTSSSATTFTIENTGNATLNLTGSLNKVAISGTNSSEFSINETSISSTVAASGSTTFTVTFSPTSTGAKSAAISIANDDSNENPYVINLTGTGTVNSSSASDIITQPGYTYSSNIDYASKQTATTLTTANSVGVNGLTLRDGGATTDADALGTTLTDITFSTGGSTAIRTAALFDGTNIAEVAVNGATSFAFTGLTLSATDGSTKDFELRVTYQSTVTDNQQINYTVSSATASVATSSFASANAGAAASSASNDINRLEVTATLLAFVQQPSNVLVNSAMSPSPTISSNDANGNRDLDYVTNMTASTTGTFAGGSTNTVTPISGLGTFNNLQFSTSSTGKTIAISSGSLTASGNSSTFNITVQEAGLLNIDEDFNYAPSSNIISVGTGWGIIGTTASSKVNTTNINEGLTLTNYPSTNTTGISFNNASSSEDVGKSFTTQISGSIYASTLINLTNASGGHIIGFTATNTSSNYEVRIYVRTVSSNLNFGIARGSGTVTWDPTNYSLNTTYFVALKLTMNSLTNDDNIDLFVLSSIPNYEPIIPNASIVNVTDVTTIGAYYIRQDAGAGAGKIDGIRVASNWGSLVGNPQYSTTSNIAAGNYNSIDILSGTLTATGNVNIYNGSVTVASGATFATVNNLTLKSDANGTARIGNSAGTITGNVTVERYIPATRRAYRFLAAPVTTTGGIYANWQESGTNATGIGIQVTGVAGAAPGGVDNDSGLDKTLTGSSSMFTYDGTNWVAVTNTKNTQLTPGAGFRVLVRGDRLTDLYASNPPATATTIKATGAVGQGTITLNSLVTGFNLLGNPYPSAIDWDASGWGTARNATNVYDAIYIYDPANVASTSMTYPAYITGVGGTNGGSNIIRSGQAFFVEAAASASISFLEAYKSTTVTGGFFRSATPEMMRVTYMQNNEHLDDIIINFNDDAQADFDPRFDAISMGGDANGLASFKNADRLAIHTRPKAVGDDSVALSVRNTANGNYQLKFSEMEGFAASTNITLLDKFLNVQYDVKQDSIVNFEITSDVNSKGDDRFWLFYNHKSTGVNQQALTKNKINVYPNPASSVINLSLKLAANQKSTYTYNIYNQLGAMVQAGVVDFADDKQTQINIDAFSAGVYFITASNGKDLQTIKFVK